MSATGRCIPTTPSDQPVLRDPERAIYPPGSRNIGLEPIGGHRVLLNISPVESSFFLPPLKSYPGSHDRRKTSMLGRNQGATVSDIM